MAPTASARGDTTLTAALRGARARRIRRSVGEAASDGEPEDAAAAGAPDAPDGDLLPARRRRRDGLFGVLGPDAAAGAGRRDRLPRQVPRVRRGRPRRHARPEPARARARAPVLGPAARGGVPAARARAGARLR